MGTGQGEERRPNALIGEKSPYLLQHAYNPVEWMPWGEEARRRAKEEGKPIFLSIGYSTCHWCHVMERESFSDPKIARIINKHFIPVKVDREERPDVDEFYMRAVQAMTGQGGWPLTVFLTPDLEPFFGGTYFPPERRFGLPSLKEVLLAVANEWRERREELSSSGGQLLSLLHQSLRAGASAEEPSLAPLDLAYEHLVLSFDKDFGGFSDAPKFPMPGYIALLLRHWRIRRERTALVMAEKTLTQMYLGGIYDHVGGGFHRYATDRAWLIPHFEKMLYDNAQLLRIYCEAYQASSKKIFEEVALDIAAWLLREMRGEEGLFYSAIDADSEGEEGRYYVWTEKELRELFGEDEGRVVARFLGVTEHGNFERGRSVIHLAGRIEELAASLGMDTSEALSYVRHRLSEARERRVKPLIDDKALVSWNGLAISALAYAGMTLRRSDLLAAARNAADALLRNLVVGDELRRYWRSGPSSVPAMLEDYASLGCALIDLWQYSGEAGYLERAAWAAGRIMNSFWAEEGGFYLSPPGLSDVPLKLVDAYDGPLPSGNSLAFSLLARLYLITGKEEYRERAIATLRRFWGAINTSPTGFSYMTSSLGLLSQEHKQLIVVLPQDVHVEEVLSKIPRVYEPYMVISLLREDEEYPLLSDVLPAKKTINGRPTYYLCRAFTCKAPTTSEDVLREMLEEDATP